MSISSSISFQVVTVDFADYEDMELWRSKWTAGQLGQSTMPPRIGDLETEFSVPPHCSSDFHLVFILNCILHSEFRSFMASFHRCCSISATGPPKKQVRAWSMLNERRDATDISSAEPSSWRPFGWTPTISCCSWRCHRCPCISRRLRDVLSFLSEALLTSRLVKVQERRQTRRVSTNSAAHSSTLGEIEQSPKSAS